MLALALLVLSNVVFPISPAVLEARPVVADTVVITEWEVPWEQSRPRDPIVDADGNVWFVGQRGNYIAVLDPETDEFKRYEIPEGALPHNIIVGPEGYLWYAGNGDAHIGRLDPKSEEIVRYDMPDPEARDPHTLQFAPDGSLWFTVQGGNMIGHMNPEAGRIEFVKVPIERARPYGLVIDANSRPWIALFGTNHIASVDPKWLDLELYPLPWEDARPRRLQVSSDGMVWYVDYARGALGRLDPGSGEATEWPSPGGAGSRPYAMAIDDRERLWYVETGVEPNQFVGYDPASGEFFSVTPIPSGAGSVRHMVFYPPTRTVWFGTDANTIGRAVLP
jgi:virginiamycin B lyase